ncbi:MAG: selenide, water dikinase SelD [Rhodospirillales bacterium]|nr:selenide, water dikinase SelD [Rhodospirillales bacterium]
MSQPGFRLTDLAHGGGCGCKLAPAVLQQLLARMPLAAAAPGLLVGTETSDDAAVYRLNANQALVATTDFFMPVVDDPRDFGRIAATNALSDVYAMGGTPVMALAILGMPVDKLPVEVAQAILAGGAEVCAEAGIPLAGGHSIDSPEPIYGLVALGLVHPDRVLRNSTARPGDTLILTKPLGVGIYSAALKRNQLPPALQAAMLASTTQLNLLGAELADLPGVGAATDVTGFGLLGHTLEMCRGSGLAARITADDLPLLPEVEALSRSGIGTGAATRNWASYGAEVILPDDFPDWRRALLCDPQTSGGLLIAAAPEAVQEVLARAHRLGFAQAVTVGTLHGGTPRVTVS